MMKKGRKNDSDFDIYIYKIPILKPKHVFIYFDIGDSENFEKVHHVNQMFQVLRH